MALQVGKICVLDSPQLNNNNNNKAQQRILAFTSLFPFYLMIIYINFAHTSLYVMVLQVGKICVLDLPLPSQHTQSFHNFFKLIFLNPLISLILFLIFFIYFNLFFIFWGRK